jgi:F-box-like
MHFQSLPQEILLHILRDVGAAQFQANVAQLHVCKSWYPAAQCVMVEELCLSEKNLPYFLARMLEQKWMWRLIETNCRTVKLRIRGPQDKSILRTRSPEFEWNARISPCLTYLATRLSRFTRLEHLIIEATAPDPLPSGFQSYLRNQQIANFLSPRYGSRLKSLSLDLCHTLKREPVSNVCGNHLCAFVSKFLLTLKHVRIRMDAVCAEALEVGDDEQIPNLESVIFNMYIPDTDAKPGYPAEGRALVCQTEEDYPLKCPLRRMIRAAKRLSEKTTTLKTARIVTSFYPEPRPVAIDCISGQKIILKDRNDWTGDGSPFHGFVCGDSD